MLIPSLVKNMCESICSNWTYTHIFLMQQDVKYFRFCCESAEKLKRHLLTGCLKLGFK